MGETKRPNEGAQYIAEQRTVDVLDVLRKISDERHPVTKQEIFSEVVTTENPQTLSNTVDEILLQINPVEYTGDNDHEYRIKYEGYDTAFDDNPLMKKADIKELRKELRRDGADKKAIQKKIDKLSGGKAPSITGIRYVHPFSYEDMDKLISAVVLSASIAPADKEQLIQKIMDTASMYYSSPFYDRADRKIRFNPLSEYGRLHSRDGAFEKRLGDNIKIIQEAISLKTKVRFYFDVYGAEKEYISDEKIHEITPYYIVIYHDNYYVIGAWDSGEKACHYRIEFMSGLEIIRNASGLPVPMRAMSECKDLPSRDATWDPGKYMAEHLNMAYDTPRNIKIKLSTKYSNRYTILHDWFGDNFKLNKTETAKCEDGYEVVEVKTSPYMIVHWALQYADVVEILDEEVRKNIEKELEVLKKKYGAQ